MRPAHLTLHAQARAQQRAISNLQIQLLQVFGEDHYQKGGTHVSHIPKDTCAQLRRALDKIDGVAMVKDKAGRAITLEHMDKRFNVRGGA